MRTTLSLDPDVDALLREEMRRTGGSFKETVNQLLRRGLMSSNQAKRKPFRVVPRAMGLPAGLSYDNVASLLEAIEGPTHR